MHEDWFTSEPQPRAREDVHWGRPQKYLRALELQLAFVRLARVLVVLTHDEHELVLRVALQPSLPSNLSQGVGSLCPASEQLSRGTRPLVTCWIASL